MADVLTAAQRQLNMSRIRGRDTRPELLVRRGLHRLGFRYRLHSRALPGRPDLAFPGRHAVVFVHGCFWHGHGCPMCKAPATRRDFWASKIATNRTRDLAAIRRLGEAGWRVLVVWECALRGPARLPTCEVLDACANFLNSNMPSTELAGTWKTVLGRSQPL